MKDPLKARFEAGRKVDLNPRSVQVYEERMQKVLPEIAQNIRGNQQRLADVRASNKSRRRRDQEAAAKS